MKTNCTEFETRSEHDVLFGEEQRKYDRFCYVYIWKHDLIGLGLRALAHCEQQREEIQVQW